MSKSRSKRSRSLSAKKGWRTRRATKKLADAFLRQASKAHGIDYTKMNIQSKANLKKFFESGGNFKALAARDRDDEGNLFDEKHRNPFWYH